MRKLALALAIVLLVAGFVYRARRVPNPDPNHTHADFAVWVDGNQVDFSGSEFMSGESDEEDSNHNRLSPYLHLHDGNGFVIHRHKPGLTLKDFLASIQLSFEGKCEIALDIDGTICGETPFRLFVNGTERTSFDLNYDFQDGDQLLITNASDDTELKMELSIMSDDACKYSQTCPGRGAPPTENCIADPAVPCVE